MRPLLGVVMRRRPHSLLTCDTLPYDISLATGVLCEEAGEQGGQRPAGLSRVGRLRQEARAAAGRLHRQGARALSVLLHGWGVGRGVSMQCSVKRDSGGAGEEGGTQTQIREILK